ncbi:Kae1-associated serine/threonine protein kinase [Candidatus Micrarchaeota archaeon]|nr:Kae1-associated serine/threonine protein kinase [Candidatus Micrarchaeota archaeon]
MDQLSIGAEAVVTKKGEVIVKHRLPKKYRLPELDEKIRKFRTKREARILQRLSSVIRVPKVLHQGADVLELEFIHGELLKKGLNSVNCRLTGQCVGKMHAAHVIHGDLTPSNVLVERHGVCLVDFGLAYSSHKLEDFATDVHVFEELVSPECFDAFWHGYQTVMPQANDVQKRLEKIKGRGRYRKASAKPENKY